MRFHQTQKFDEGCVSTAERYIICQMLSSDSILLHYHNCIFVGSNKTSLRLVNYSISWEVAPFCSVVHLRERLLWWLLIPCCVSMRCWCLECHPVGYSLMTSYHHHNLKTWSAPGWSFFLNLRYLFAIRAHNSLPLSSLFEGWMVGSGFMIQIHGCWQKLKGETLSTNDGRWIWRVKHQLVQQI